MERIISFSEAGHMFSDVWHLYRKYAVQKLNDAEIDAFTEEARKIHEKYKYPVVKEIVLAVIGEIERSVKHFEGGEKWKK